MGLVVNALTKFAKSSVGSELYRWGTSEAGKMFLCTKMPLIETGLATASRVYATEKQDLSRREKNVLQAGHIVPAIFGISIGSVLNKKVYNLADKVVENLDPKKVSEIPKIKSALRVCLPIFSTALLLRLIFPVATAFVSGEIEEHKAKKKLDIKA